MTALTDHAALENTLADHAMATFGNATITLNAASAVGIMDRETPDALIGSRTNRWIMQLRAGSLSLAVGDETTVTGQHAGDYRVLDVDEGDGLVYAVTLGLIVS